MGGKCNAGNWSDSDNSVWDDISEPDGYARSATESENEKDFKSTGSGNAESIIEYDASLLLEPQARGPEDPSSRSRYYCVDAKLYERSFDMSPLCQRAWVFQERRLAPRTLHFGRHQIFWECQKIICYETFPMGMPFDDQSYSNNLWVPGKYRRLERSWDDVVQQYTACKLTKTSDKLIAISGVARKFSDLYGAQYLFGIWREHLPAALLWKADGGPVRKPFPFRAPTWSWISNDGDIKLLVSEKSDKLLCKVISIEAPIDPFGHDKECVIVLECQRLLKLVNLTSHETSFSAMVPAAREGDFSFNCKMDNGENNGAEIQENLYLLEVLEAKTIKWKSGTS